MTLWTRIRTACAELAVDCRAAMRGQSEALDHPLPPVRRLGLWLHLLICKWCRRYGRQICFLRETASQHPDELTAAGAETLSAEARERIKQRLRNVDKPHSNTPPY
jgi:hypothetical protein